MLEYVDEGDLKFRLSCLAVLIEIGKVSSFNHRSTFRCGYK